MCGLLMIFSLHTYNNIENTTFRVHTDFFGSQVVWHFLKARACDTFFFNVQVKENIMQATWYATLHHLSKLWKTP